MTKAIQVLTSDNIKNTVDFAIITIREDEFAATLNYFPPTAEAKGKHRTYEISDIKTLDEVEYRVAILRTAEQGHSSAQSATTDVILDLNPTWIVVVGIAGAIPESEFSLGDVVIANRMIDFSVTAATTDGNIETAHRGSPAHKSVQNLISRLPALTTRLGEWNTSERLGVTMPNVCLDDDNFIEQDVNLKKKLHNSLKERFKPDNGETLRLPLVTASPIASGNMLVKDPKVLKNWTHSARDLKAIEMELPGIYEAARSIGDDRPVIAIRGISDIIGFKRDPAWTGFACRTAASLTRALINLSPITAKPKTSKNIIEVQKEIEHIEITIENINKINLYLGNTLGILLSTKSAIKPLYENYNNARKDVVSTFDQLKKGFRPNFNELKEKKDIGAFNKSFMKSREIIIPIDDLEISISNFSICELKPRMQVAFTKIKENYQILNSSINEHNKLCDDFMQLKDPRLTCFYFGIPDLSEAPYISNSLYADNFKQIYNSMERIILNSWLLIKDFDSYLTYLERKHEEKCLELVSMNLPSKKIPDRFRININRFSNDKLMPTLEEWESFINEFN
ncbi:MAG TPA: hypothetical protein PL131_02085 [Methylotenera sp.]|nr:hypothetical protein [Methylotenera sp.]HPH04636.1 hypothetical protein [Methylotenera sp.]HPN01650.1 hypothetical protein [Methylotenera sp.]